MNLSTDVRRRTDAGVGVGPVMVSRCQSYSLLLCGLFYEAICFMSYLVSFCSCVFQSF